MIYVFFAFSAFKQSIRLISVSYLRIIEPKPHLDFDNKIYNIQVFVQSDDKIMMIFTYLGIFFTGVAVGLVSTIFGVGGGILMVPLLSLILPISHLEAIATSLATIVFVAGFNTFNFSKKNVIVWSIVPWIALTSSFFAFISAELSTVLPETVLVLIFLIFLLNVAIRTFLIPHETAHNPPKSHSRLLPLAIGTASGLISGVTGIGGGGITTPMMLVTRLVKNIQAAPTSNAIMIFTTFFASLAFAIADPGKTNGLMLGYIHLDTALLLFAGSASISRIGVRMNQHIPLFWRKTVLGLLLLFICIRLVFLLLN
jgi:hypothetical protein